MQGSDPGGPPAGRSSSLVSILSGFLHLSSSRAAPQASKATVRSNASAPAMPPAPPTAAAAHAGTSTGAALPQHFYSSAPAATSAPPALPTAPGPSALPAQPTIKPDPDLQPTAVPPGPGAVPSIVVPVVASSAVATVAPAPPLPMQLLRHSPASKAAAASLRPAEPLPHFATAAADTASQSATDIAAAPNPVFNTNGITGGASASSAGLQFHTMRADIQPAESGAADGNPAVVQSASAVANTSTAATTSATASPSSGGGGGSGPSFEACWAKYRLRLTVGAIRAFFDEETQAAAREALVDVAVYGRLAEGREPVLECRNAQLRIWRGQGRLTRLSALMVDLGVPENGRVKLVHDGAVGGPVIIPLAEPMQGQAQQQPPLSPPQQQQQVVGAGQGRERPPVEGEGTAASAAAAVQQEVPQLSGEHQQQPRPQAPVVVKVEVQDPRQRQEQPQGHPQQQQAHQQPGQQQQQAQQQEGQQQHQAQQLPGVVVKTEEPSPQPRLRQQWSPAAAGWRRSSGAADLPVGQSAAAAAAAAIAAAAPVVAAAAAGPSGGRPTGGVAVPSQHGAGSSDTGERGNGAAGVAGGGDRRADVDREVSMSEAVDTEVVNWHYRQEDVEEEAGGEGEGEASDRTVTEEGDDSSYAAEDEEDEELGEEELEEETALGQPSEATAGADAAEGGSGAQEERSEVAEQAAEADPVVQAHTAQTAEHGAGAAAMAATSPGLSCLSRRPLAGVGQGQNREGHAAAGHAAVGSTAAEAATSQPPRKRRQVAGSRHHASRSQLLYVRELTASMLRHGTLSLRTSHRPAWQALLGQLITATGHQRELKLLLADGTPYTAWLSRSQGPRGPDSLPRWKVGGLHEWVDRQGARAGDEAELSAGPDGQLSLRLVRVQAAPAAAAEAAAAAAQAPVGQAAHAGSVEGAAAVAAAPAAPPQLQMAAADAPLTAALGAVAAGAAPPPQPGGSAFAAAAAPATAAAALPVAGAVGGAGADAGLAAAGSGTLLLPCGAPANRAAAAPAPAPETALARSGTTALAVEVNERVLQDNAVRLPVHFCRSVFSGLIATHGPGKDIPVRLVDEADGQVYDTQLHGYANQRAYVNWVLKRVKPLLHKYSARGGTKLRMWKVDSDAPDLFHAQVEVSAQGSDGGGGGSTGGAAAGDVAAAATAAPAGRKRVAAGDADVPGGLAVRPLKRAATSAAQAAAAAGGSSGGGGAAISPRLAAAAAAAAAVPTGPAPSITHLHGCVPPGSHGACGLPPLLPGELRLCGLTFHPDLAPGVRRLVAQWEQDLGVRLAHADPAAVQVRLPAPVVAASSSAAPGAVAASAAVAAAAAPPQQPSWRVTFDRHRLSANIVCSRLARYLGLLIADREWDAELPSGRLELIEGVEPVGDIERGGAGLAAMVPLRRNDVIGVVGGYVMPPAAAQHFASRGFRECRGELVSELAARAAPAEVMVAWQFVAGAFRMPYQELELTPEGAAGPTALELNMLGYGNFAALINDPRVMPRAWEEGNDVDSEPEANCMVVPVSVRGLVLPVLVALRDIAPGEQLLRDYGAEWWRQLARPWENLDFDGVPADKLLHPSGAAAMSGEDEPPLLQIEELVPYSAAAGGGGGETGAVFAAARGEDGGGSDSRLAASSAGDSMAARQMVPAAAAAVGGAAGGATGCVTTSAFHVAAIHAAAAMAASADSLGPMWSAEAADAAAAERMIPARADVGGGMHGDGELRAGGSEGAAGGTAAAGDEEMAEAA